MLRQMILVLPPEFREAREQGSGSGGDCTVPLPLHFYSSKKMEHNSVLGYHSWRTLKTPPKMPRMWWSSLKGSEPTALLQWRVLHGVVGTNTDEEHVDSTTATPRPFCGRKKHSVKLAISDTHTQWKTVNPALMLKPFLKVRLRTAGHLSGGELGRGFMCRESESLIWLF